MNKLPIDLQRYISFDPTYHEHYQYEIMPYLENLWTIKYMYKHNVKEVLIYLIFFLDHLLLKIGVMDIGLKMALT